MMNPQITQKEQRASDHLYIWVYNLKVENFRIWVFCGKLHRWTPRFVPIQSRQTQSTKNLISG